MSGYYDKEGNRKVPYTEDSTRGKSLIQPIHYKGDMILQAWIDARVIATLSKWMEKNGLYPRTISEVGRRPLEMLVERLVEDGEVEMVEETSVARRELEMRYRVRLNKGGRGGKNILHNQVLSEQRKEYPTMRASIEEEERKRIVDEAVKKYKELYPDTVEEVKE